MTHKPGVYVPLRALFLVGAVEQYRQAVLTTCLRGLSSGMKYFTRLSSFDTNIPI